MNFLKLFFLINIFNFVTSFSDYGLICNNPKLLEHYSRKYVINKDKLMNEKLSILDKNFQLPDCKFKEFVPDLKSGDNKIIDKGTDDYFKEKKCVLFGLPGAFTSKCSKLHLPGFVVNADKIKAKGIENIFCLSVNDPYVMNGWGEINNIGDKIKMLSDPYLLFTKAIGAEVDRNAKGMGIRSNRYLMVIENFKIVNIHVEKETKECGLTSAENLLNNLL